MPHFHPRPSVRLSDSEALVAIVYAVLGVGVVIGLAIYRVSDDDAVLRTFDALGNLGTILIPLLAGLFSLWWWRQRGATKAKLNVSQSITPLPASLESPTRDLYITACLKNEGEVAVEIDNWCLWAVSLDSLPDNVSESLDQDGHACRDFQLDFEPVAGDEFAMIGDSRAEMLAGEAQSLSAFLRVPHDSQVLRIYSFFPCHTLEEGEVRGRGWTTTSIVVLNRFNKPRDPIEGEADAKR